MIQVAILLLDLLTGRASAQLVCDAIAALEATVGTPENVKALTSRLRDLAAKLAPEIAREAHAVADWCEAHPWAWEHQGNPDMGQNEQAPSRPIILDQEAKTDPDP
jgi:hypothetical protein